VPRTAFYFIPSAMTGVFPFRNRVSPKEAFEGLEPGEGKPSRPVLRGPGGRNAAWLLGSHRRKRCSKPSSATSIGCGRALGAALTERICHSHRHSPSERPLESRLIVEPKRWCTTADLFVLHNSCPHSLADAPTDLPTSVAQPFFCHSFF